MGVLALLLLKNEGSGGKGTLRFPAWDLQCVRKEKTLHFKDVAFIGNGGSGRSRYRWREGRWPRN